MEWKERRKERKSDVEEKRMKTREQKDKWSGKYSKGARQRRQLRNMQISGIGLE
jgi:hypothetical protein